MVFEDKNIGVDDEKLILHYKRWDVYMNKKINLIKGFYSIGVSCSDGKKLI